MEDAELRAAAESHVWFHSMELRPGIVTRGPKTREMLAQEAEAMLGMLDLRGRSVLDIGAWNGFFSFEAWRARRVQLGERWFLASLFSTIVILELACALSGGIRSPVLPVLFAPVVTLFAAFGRSRQSAAAFGLAMLLAAALAALPASFLLPLPADRACRVVTLGALLLIQLTVHVRHLRNWLLFRHALRSGGVTGHLEYARHVALRASAFEFLEFGVLYAFIYAFTPAGPFVLGGAFACAVSAIGQYRLARAHNRPAVTS